VAIAGLAVVVLLAGACQSAGNAPTASQTPSAAPSAADAAAATATVCAAFSRAKDDFTASAVASAGVGDSTAALKEALTKFTAVVKGQIPVATDPRLRAALQETATAAEAYAAAPDLAGADDGPFAKAGAKLDGLCEPAASAGPSTATAAQGSSVGGAGTRCQLPVSFEAARSWEVKAIKVPAGGGSLRKGPLAAACELNAEPAGQLAYVRVWAGAAPQETPRQLLEVFLHGEDVRKPTYTDVTVGGQPAVEVAYDYYSETTKETRKERAFAVATPKGAVVVEIGGLDAEDEAITSAYELAKRTLTLNR
jgi:hypothetical protein